MGISQDFLGHAPKLRSSITGSPVPSAAVSGASTLLAQSISRSNSRVGASPTAHRQMSRGARADTTAEK